MSDEADIELGSVWWDRGIRDTFTVVSKSGDYVSGEWGDGSGPTTVSVGEMLNDFDQVVDTDRQQFDAERQRFDGGGMRDVETGKPRFDLLCPQRVPYEHQYLTRVAKLMGRGAEHYEDRNWEQFADDAAYQRARSSAFRHFMQWFNGETDEDHAASVFFNVQAAEYVAGRMRGDW